jgi:hypothetical protein
MHAMVVVVIPEGVELARQIDRVPEEDAVQVLTPDRPDQTLNERMRHRCAGEVYSDHMVYTSYGHMGNGLFRGHR